MFDFVKDWHSGATRRELPLHRHAQIEDYFLANASIPPEQEGQIAREWDRVKTHSFKPYTGPLTLFRAQAQPILCSFDPEMNWGELAKGRVSVEIVSGLHADVMNPRNIRVVAGKLKKCIEEVSSNQYSVFSKQ